MRLFDLMRRNPADNWSMSDVEKLCREHGLSCSSPSCGGSHYKISHPAAREILTIPYRRPIKPVYIRKLVKLVEALEEK